MPLGSSKELIKRDDLGLVEITPVELEGLIFGLMNTTLAAELLEVSQNQE